MVFCICILLLFLILAFTGYFFSSKILYKRIKTPDRIIEIEKRSPTFDMQWFDALSKERVTIASPSGYPLNGLFIPAGTHSGKTIIFSHGVTVSHLSAVKYSRMFYEKGWNLFLYDQRRHGESGGIITSYGYYEKYDLREAVHYIQNRIPNGIIGIHGESMGASTMLEYAGMEDGADFYISDCAYSSLWSQFTHLIKSRYHLPAFPVLHITGLFVRWRGKFRIKEINPLLHVKKINKPILFIHGDVDTYVPTWMSVALSKAANGMSELYLAENAGHAQALMVDPGKYEAMVFRFLEKSGIIEK